MREAFITQRATGNRALAVSRANEIIAEYQPQGYVLTVRQIFYQMVARGWIENSARKYKHVSLCLTLGRNNGSVDWDAIEDRRREMVTPTSWGSPAEILRAAAESYRENPWETQRWRPEIWVEKEALAGIVGRACEEYRVPYFPTVGNGSAGELYAAGKRLAEYQDQGLAPVVFHLADHDPNGIDMTRDVERRLARYARSPVEVRRIGLTMRQVRRFQPPPNFAKEKDPNLKKYIREFGTSQCWELDALSPQVIVDLVRDELAKLIDQRLWRKALAAERRNRRRLAAIARGVK